MKRVPRRGVAASSLVLAALVLLAAGAVGTLLIVPPAVPQSLTTGESPTTAPVTSQEFADSRTVQITLDLADPTPVASSASGLVTVSSCQPGGEVASGTSLLTVDGKPLVVLATSMPMWRDLEPGAHGQDVTSLQGELRRLGYDVPEDGYYRWATRHAVDQMLNAAGTDLPSSGTLSRSSIVWLPAPTATIDTCDVQVGTQLSAGAPIATLPAQLEGITIANVPGDLQRGARHLDFGEFTVPTDANDRVSDPEALQRITDSALYPALLGDAAADGTSVTWTLDEAVPVVAVPPQALYDQVDRSACIQDAAGAAFSVTVVSASLGQSLVTINGDAGDPERVALTPDESAPCT